MPLSAYSARKIAEHTVGLSPASWPPSAWYVSLHTADPGPSGTDEVTGGSYARVNNTSWVWDTDRVENNAIVQFDGLPVATVTHFAVWTASSGGNLLWYDEVTTPRTFASGDSGAFSVGNLSAKFV